jgi:uncharacterized protein
LNASSNKLNGSNKKLEHVLITNLKSNQNTLEAKYCESFFCRLRGFMFKKTIKAGEGLLLVESSDSRVNASIHMFFMNFDIAVVWINSHFIVVDKIIAKKGKPFYAPRHPAKFILETHPDQLETFQIGDQVIFTHD